MDNSNIPEEYRPISAWGYVGYNLLFSIPFVGIILLITVLGLSSYMKTRLGLKPEEYDAKEIYKE